MIDEDTVDKLKSLRDEIEDVKQDISSKAERLLDLCKKIEGIAEEVDSIDNTVKSETRLAGDLSRIIEDFRLVEKVDRSLPTLRNDILREAENREEIEDILREIRNI